jgi:TatD DNase family protein
MSIIFSMDAHMHFDLYKDRKLIADYIENGKSYTIAVTNLPDIFEKYYSDYSQYKYMRLALGFHPELIYEYQNLLPIFFRNIEKTRYIGEIGLDFTTVDKKNRDKQVEIFTQIIQACNYKHKILTVHTRKAHEEVIRILEKFQGRVILHWYSGSVKEMQVAIERQYYFSINHQMIRSKAGRNIINNIPINRILIESDAPFTFGLKAKYDLFFIYEIYSYLAKTKSISVNEASEVIKNNFKQVLL